MLLEKWNIFKTRDLCTKYNIVLIFDELLTGFRESKGGYQLRYGITPDLSTFGKAISNGYPLAAVAGKAEVMSSGSPGQVLVLLWERTMVTKSH